MRSSTGSAASRSGVCSALRELDVYAIEQFWHLFGPGGASTWRLRLAVWPGLCLTVVVYCLNMVGDAVRDLLAPRLRGGSGRLGAYGAQAVGKADSTAHPARS